MIPDVSPIDTNPLSTGAKAADAPRTTSTPADDSAPAPAGLPPEEVRKAVETSWRRNEVAYRYLGR